MAKKIVQLIIDIVILVFLILLDVLNTVYVAAFYGGPWWLVAMIVYTVATVLLIFRLKSFKEGENGENK